MTSISVRVGIVIAATYMAFWLFSAYQYFGRQQFDALFLLGLASMPSSYIVDELVHALMNASLLSRQSMTQVEYLGILFLGALQYFVVGFLVTSVLRILLSHVMRHFKLTR